MGLVLLPLLSACGPAEELAEPSAPGSQAQELAGSNGLAFNGLNSTSFHSWFQEQPGLRNTLMSYLIQCAADSAETRTEGCFFGNLFNSSEGLYAVSDGPLLQVEESTARGCALSSVNLSHRPLPLCCEDCSQSPRSFVYPVQRNGSVPQDQALGRRGRG